MKIKDLTKDEITRSAITELTKQGGRVRKVHNGGAYRKRKYQVEKGHVDIQGYSKEGICLYCEVKTIGDKFSKEQIEILDDLDKCGGISLVAIQVGTQVNVVPWNEYKKEKLNRITER
jgi:hypothetical protein